MSESRKKTEQIQFRLTPELRKILDAYSKQQGKTRTEVLTEFIRSLPQDEAENPKQ